MSLSARTKTSHNARTVLAHIHEYISGQGFFFTKQDIANFYLSLKTKPFVILAGISGTGKTQLVRQFAAAIGCKDNCTLIPVRPDWTDNADLMGYTDISGKFRGKALFSTIIRAHQHPEEIFFVILDEMNLARVEHYFSDFLSIMETREKVGETIQTDPILTEEMWDPDFTDLSFPLGLPENLYLIGTVNMDETTHPFSRKVLDRANSIEMNDVHLDWPMADEGIEPLEGVYNDFLISVYVQPKDVSEAEKQRMNSTLNFLSDINQILKKADLQFGYRVRDEIAFYLLNRHEIRELISEQEAIDLQVMQKILPRIHGSSRRVGLVLFELIRKFAPATIDLPSGLYASEIVERLGEPRKKGYKFPRTLEKLLLMYRRFEEDGFTSFWM
ncbi:MAG: AAA family ATPase [Bacteroidia bacterium]|nr:AAA family ATPase [Bacteroidia bacterium]